MNTIKRHEYYKQFKDVPSLRKRPCKLAYYSKRFTIASRYFQNAVSPLLSSELAPHVVSEVTTIIIKFTAQNKFY